MELTYQQKWLKACTTHSAMWNEATTHGAIELLSYHSQLFQHSTQLSRKLGEKFRKGWRFSTAHRPPPTIHRCFHAINGTYRSRATKFSGAEDDPKASENRANANANAKPKPFADGR
ncbi:hypothetical protein M5D96_004989 [Drosophila gunungcola]|uniref:Uncharacterized protein n=1 Tax=Drosophila gunungcola TaxID=103775 RepID=A0A9Q0BTK0_9MUSC|nr:hypothetical protein M5D96_004989 [Drosophila gunungcola]